MLKRPFFFVVPFWCPKRFVKKVQVKKVDMFSPRFLLNHGLRVQGLRFRVEVSIAMDGKPNGQSENQLARGLVVAK